ncbi:MAG: hypothetical protein M9927_07780 [Anaerolineae bacterium]|nr:hypothetical protein [Anaerolineae bacterium]
MKRIRPRWSSPRPDPTASGQPEIMRPQALLEPPKPAAFGCLERRSCQVLTNYHVRQTTVTTSRPICP